MNKILLNILKNSTYETIDNTNKRYFCVYWCIYKEKNEYKSKICAFNALNPKEINNLDVKTQLSEGQEFISIAPTLEIPDDFKDIIRKYKYE